MKMQKSKIFYVFLMLFLASVFVFTNFNLEKLDYVWAEDDEVVNAVPLKITLKDKRSGLTTSSTVEIHFKSYCGNKLLERGEACDDGNASYNDWCVNCQFAYCGDGYLNESIDTVMANNNDPQGDMKILRREECDPGEDLNSADDDVFLGGLSGTENMRCDVDCLWYCVEGYHADYIHQRCDSDIVNGCNSSPEVFASHREWDPVTREFSDCLVDICDNVHGYYVHSDDKSRCYECDKSLYPGADTMIYDKNDAKCKINTCRGGGWEKVGEECKCQNEIGYYLDNQNDENCTLCTDIEEMVGATKTIYEGGQCKALECNADSDYYLNSNDATCEHCPVTTDGVLGMEYHANYGCWATCDYDAGYEAHGIGGCSCDISRGYEVDPEGGCRKICGNEIQNSNEDCEIGLHGSSCCDNSCKYVCQNNDKEVNLPFINSDGTKISAVSFNSEDEAIIEMPRCVTTASTMTFDLSKRVVNKNASIIFITDNSGSMKNDIDDVRTALNGMLDSLDTESSGRGIYVGLVEFGTNIRSFHSVGLISNLVHKNSLKGQINNYKQTEDSTYVKKAFEKAKGIFNQPVIRNGNVVSIHYKMIVFLADGQSGDTPDTVISNLKTDDKIKIYTITYKVSSIADDMRQWSSCDGVVENCHYAFKANSSNIDDIYGDILEVIIGDPDLNTVTGGIVDKDNMKITLNVDSNFCASIDPDLVPTKKIQINFNGGGHLSLTNGKMNYCPACGF